MPVQTRRTKWVKWKHCAAPSSTSAIWRRCWPQLEIIRSSQQVVPSSSLISKKNRWIVWLTTWTDANPGRIYRRWRSDCRLRATICPPFTIPARRPNLRVLTFTTDRPISDFYSPSLTLPALHQPLRLTRNASKLNRNRLPYSNKSYWDRFPAGSLNSRWRICCWIKRAAVPIIISSKTFRITAYWNRSTAGGVPLCKHQRLKHLKKHFFLSLSINCTNFASYFLLESFLPTIFTTPYQNKGSFIFCNANGLQ